MADIATDTRAGSRTVRARKARRCGAYVGGGWCTTRIEPGDDYVRVVVFPGHECNDGPAPLVLVLCVPCATEYGRPLPPRRGRRKKSAHLPPREAAGAGEHR